MGPRDDRACWGRIWFFTFKTGFIQRKPPMATAVAIERPGGQRRHQPLRRTGHGAGATIGTGSIVAWPRPFSRAAGRGVLMWITGVFGIATKYAEVYAAVKHACATTTIRCRAVPCIFGSARSGATPGGQARSQPRRAYPGGRSSALWRLPRSRPSRPSNRFGRAGVGHVRINTSNVTPAWIVGDHRGAGVGGHLRRRSPSRRCASACPHHGCRLRGRLAWVILAFNWALVSDALGLILECAFT